MAARVAFASAQIQFRSPDAGSASATTAMTTKKAQVAAPSRSTLRARSCPASNQSAASAAAPVPSRQSTGLRAA
ncbi:hypothetical protein [Streptomyces hokutonensis]|uniref:hypothetical protein n=1 Tax=Streptomyces hokutonensis TaxID=1306990 RepID=UPI0003799ACC|nr:hypothetical protein [Streptomyces hokutonensis]